MSYPFTNITIQPLDSEHIADTLSCVPASFHSDLLADYERKYAESRRDANLGLLQVQEYAKSHKFLNYEDETLRKKADRLARHAHRMINQGGLDAALSLLDNNGIDAPDSETEQSLTARLVDSV